MIRFILSFLCWMGSAQALAAQSSVFQAEDGDLQKKITKADGYVFSERKRGGHVDFRIDTKQASGEEYKIVVRSSHPEVGKEYRVEVRTNSGKYIVKAKSDGTMRDQDSQNQVFSFSHKKDVLKVRLIPVDAETQIDSFRLIAPGTTEGQAGAVEVGEQPGEQEEDDNVVVAQPKPVIDHSKHESRAALLKELQGFGQGTTGGLNGEVCRVRNLYNSGQGSLRDCNDGSAAKWIVFDVSGTIKLTDPIKVKSNRTIDGSGQDIKIEGNGLYISKQENVILHNLTIRNINKDDAVKVYQAKNVWIHRLTLENGTDGLLDITSGSTDITVSYTQLKNHNKAMLIGANNSHTGDSDIRLTLHHNHFFNTTRRNPLIRYARVHMFNNLIENWGSGNTGDAVNATYYSQLRLENNIFVAHNDRPALRTTIPNWVEVAGYVHASGNLVLNTDDVFSEGSEKVFEPGNIYQYEAQSATPELAEYVAKASGANGSASKPTQSPYTDIPMPKDIIMPQQIEEGAQDDSLGCAMPCEKQLLDLDGIGFKRAGTGVFSKLANSDVNDETQVLVLTVMAQEQGDASIELLCEGPSSKENSIFVKVNNVDHNTYHFNRIAEKQSVKKTFRLKKGLNDLRIIPREPNLVCYSLRVQ